MQAYDPGALSIETLASAPLDAWTEWLHGAVLAFFAPAPPEHKLGAFAPFIIDPASDGPSGAIADQLRRVGRNALRVAPKATTEVLRGWSLGRDGLEGALLLVELGIQLGSLNLYAAVSRLLDQAIILSKPAQRDLSFLIAQAAAQGRFRRSEVAGLLQRLSRMDSATPTTIAELCVALAEGNPEQLHTLPTNIALILSDLPDSAFGGDVVNALARKLQFHFTELDLSAAFGPHPGEIETAAALRDRIYRAIFPVEFSDAAPDLTIDPQTRREFERRTGIAANPAAPERNARSDDPDTDR